MSPFSHQVLEAKQRLDVFLSLKTGQSRMFVKTQIEGGRVLINGKAEEKASRKLKPGDTVTGEFKDSVAFATLVPVEGELDILFEDENFLVINKAQGVVIHPAAGHRGDTLVHHLLHYLKEIPGFTELSDQRPGIVHRLDRGTSGLLLVAKRREAQESLSRQFKARTVRKEYEAIVWGVTKESGTFDSAIGRDPKDRKRMSSKSTSGRPALTRFRRLAAFRHFTHVHLFPHTGRTHQIRVHLTEGGNPIVGDDLYGVKSRLKRAPLSPKVRTLADATTQTFLHARALTLLHPKTGQPMTFMAPRPRNFEAFLGCLREHDF